MVSSGPTPKRLDDLREFKEYQKRLDGFIESENSKDLPELVVDNLGASLMEVQNNEKYQNVKRSLLEE